MSTTKKNNTIPNDTVTHSQFTEEQLKNALAIQEQLDLIRGTNTVARAVMIQVKETKPGNEKKNQDGSIQTGSDGQPLYWADRFIINTSSQDGVIAISVSQDIYDTVQEGKWYVLTGKINIKTPYEGMPKEVILYREAQPLNSLLGAL